MIYKIRFTLRTNALGTEVHEADTDMPEQAAHQIVFRILDGILSKYAIAHIWAQIRDNNGYVVVSASDGKEQNLKSDTTLREHMDNQCGIKSEPTVETYSDPEDEDDRMEKDAAYHIKPLTVTASEKVSYDQFVSRVALFRSNEGILEILLERRGDEGDYKYELPGGHLDEYDDGAVEDYVSAASRELLEETGIDISTSQLVYVCDVERENESGNHDVLFVGSIPFEDSVASAGSDADEVIWTKVDQLPDMVFEHNFLVEKALQKINCQSHVVTELPKLSDNTKRGFLIVFEGIDGSGKSSQIDKLVSKLRSHDFDVLTSKWASSELLEKSLKKAKKHKRLTPQLYALFNATDMVCRYEEEILPALAKDMVVVCDRYIYTSYVRDAIRGANTEMLNHIYDCFKQPDIVFYCTVPLDIAFKRLSQAKGLAYYGAGLDLHLSTNDETASQEYQRLMHEGYEELMTKVPTTLKISTDGDIDAIADKVWDSLKEALNNKYYPNDVED